jgi:hypothetical protein
MFPCFSFISLRSRGVFGDRWQEDDHYYEFPQLHPRKKHGIKAGRAGVGGIAVIAIFDRVRECKSVHETS